MLRAINNNRLRKRGPRRRRPPPEGLSLAELAAQAGVTPRAVRYYLARGVLPPPEFRGSRTRYDHNHLARLFAILGMRKERLDLDAIRRRLTTLTTADLEAYLPPPTPPPTTTTSFTPLLPPTYASARWEHVTLLPGVELHVRADASPVVRKVVQEIVDHCIGKDPDEPPITNTR